MAPAPKRKKRSKGTSIAKSKTKTAAKSEAKATAASSAEARNRALDSAEWSEGDHIGRYAIERAIGEGGTSYVYQAFDPTTNRSVALKVLRTGLSEQMQERFLREIEVQANIRHQNIMPVFDRGELPDGRPLLHHGAALQPDLPGRDRGAT